MTGIDPAPETIETARAHASKSGLSIVYLTGAGEHLPFPDGSFDHVTCCDVLEHVDDVDRVIAKIARVLRPGGHFFYDTINRTFISKIAMIKVMQEWRSAAFAEPNSHVWEKFIKPAELAATLERHGLDGRGCYDRGMVSVNEANGAWQVVSTKRSHRRGWCMPSLIHNMSFHYTCLYAYEDGVVDCWEGLDIALFRKKLTSGWVVTSTPKGAQLSVFNMGYGQIEKLEPLLSIEEVETRVMEAIRFWNPEFRDLVDLDGEPTEQRGGIRYAKLPSLDGAHFRVDDAGARVLAREVPVVVKDEHSLRLTRWFVYADGKSRIGPDGELVELVDAEELVQRGRVIMKVPDQTWLTVDGVGRVRLSRGNWYVDPLERIKEQRDHLVALQEGPDAITICLRQWEAYKKASSAKELELLRERYLAVPKHLRMYCGDMDSKDWPIRRALGMANRND